MSAVRIPIVDAEHILNQVHVWQASRALSAICFLDVSAFGLLQDIHLVPVVCSALL